MARGNTPRFGLLTSTSTADSLSTQDFLDDNNKIESLAVVGVQGARTARPAPGVANRLYKCTDTGDLFWDTGTQWLNAATPFPTRWIGGVRHSVSSPNANLPLSVPDSGGMYVVNNGWVTGNTTAVLDAGSPVASGSLHVTVPLPVNRSVHPTNSTLGTWQYFGADRAAASNGTLIQGAGNIFLLAAWRGMDAGPQSGGNLSVYYDPGDVVSWSFSYYTGT